MRDEDASSDADEWKLAAVEGFVGKPATDAEGDGGLLDRDGKA